MAGHPDLETGMTIAMLLGAVACRVNSRGIWPCQMNVRASHAHLHF